MDREVFGAENRRDVGDGVSVVVNIVINIVIIIKRKAERLSFFILVHTLLWKDQNRLGRNFDVVGVIPKGNLISKCIFRYTQWQ